MLDIREAMRATRLAAQRHEQMVERELDIAGAEAIRETYANPGFVNRTGKTLDATKARVVRTKGGKLVRIFNNKKHARALEGGSKPHRIEAKNARVLRFESGGDVVFVRYVNHPGTSAYRTWSKATDKAGNKLEQRLERGMQRIARNFGR